MDIFGQIEKLINEHGSAVILKERLGLAADQYSILEKKNSDLEAEIQRLKTQLQQVEKENHRLSKLAESLKESQEKSSLPEAAYSILELFFDSGRNLSREEVSSHLGQELGLVSYNFDSLREANFIQQATVGSSGSSWINARGGGSSSTPATFRITPAGRKYVVEVIRA